MAAESTYRREPTGFDAALGASTLLVGLVDAVLVVLMLVGGIRTPGWESVAHVATYSAFLVVPFLLGLLASVGIVLKCMGAGGGLAAKWPPVAFIAVRLGLFVLAITLTVADGPAWLEWTGWDGTVWVTGYLQPTTLLLLVLSLVNLRPRSESQTTSDDAMRWQRSPGDGS